MPKSKKKTTRQKALKMAEKFDKDILGEDGQLQSLLRKIHSVFRKLHYEQHDKVPFEEYYKMSQEGPMVAIEKIEKALRDANNVLGGSCVEWCNNNGNIDNIIKCTFLFT